MVPRNINRYDMLDCMTYTVYEIEKRKETIEEKTRRKETAVPCYRPGYETHNVHTALTYVRTLTEDIKMKQTNETKKKYQEDKKYELFPEYIILVFSPTGDIFGRKSVTRKRLRTSKCRLHASTPGIGQTDIVPDSDSKIPGIKFA